MAPDPYKTSNHFCQLYTLCFDAVIHRLLHITHFTSDLELCPQFSHRAFRDVEKTDGFSIRTSLIAFGQVARDADRTASNLIAKTEILLQSWIIGHMIDFHSQIFCLLPYKEVLKALSAIAPALPPLPWLEDADSSRRVETAAMGLSLRQLSAISHQLPRGANPEKVAEC